MQCSICDENPKIVICDGVGSISFLANRVKIIRPPMVSDTDYAWQRLNKTIVKIRAYPGNKQFRQSIIRVLNVANIDEWIKHIHEVIQSLGPFTVLPKSLPISFIRTSTGILRTASVVLLTPFRCTTHSYFTIEPIITPHVTNNC